MRVLVVGDAGSIFVKQFIEYVLLNGENQVVLLQESQSVPPKYLDFYNKNGVILEPLNIKQNRLIMKMPVVRSILGNKIWCKVMAKKYGKFDMIHVHGLNRNRGNIGKYLRKKTDKLAISVWGDEIFRKSADVLEKYKKYYDDADVITVSTKAMHSAFVGAYGDRYDNRLTFNKFAIGEFEIIDKIKNETTREENCREFGIKDPQKAVVLVGHNGRESQRHFELTKALSNVPSKNLEGVTLVYTMTYGVKSQEYLDGLRGEAEKLGCDFVVLTEFLDEVKIAKLRSISDVLLHAQLTDAFSASIQECLYAGCAVLNGSWLKYTDLPDSEQRLIEYSDFDEMTDKLVDVLENLDEYKERFKDNQAVLRSISSQEVTTKAWKESLNLI